MDELTLDGKTYLSSKRAAQVTGYAKDYVGQLCREGRVSARLVGRNWYVLEESILEHRFGAEKELETAEVPVTPPAPSWSAPTYTSEPLQMVPEIAPKTASVSASEPAPAPREVLADMQSAWQEWFEKEREAEKMLPDASEMLLGAGEPTAAPESEYPDVEAQAVPIHIERHTAAVPTAAVLEPVSAPVVITRSYIQPKMAVNTGREMVSPRASRSRGKGSGAILRALFVAIAGLAVATTVLGSGIVDRYIESSADSPVTRFIGGIEKVSK